jgi:alkanesulfonate monooxygenase SsuD/methylene tetrahydromethanopterin reductase-like flavin-dependent oxidoreductase (luciferase family)
MKWGIFTLSQIPDQQVRTEVMGDHIQQFKLADELGYDSIWIAEHLFSTYGIVTSCQVLMAAAAMVTKKVRIGSSVVIIPFNHPVRTAGDIALVDILSNGRVEFGVGRAYQPHEFTGLGIDMSKSREMFTEGMDVILKAWANDRIAYDGEFWRIPDPVEVLPKPVQYPHPPLWQACVSPDSFKAASESGYNMQMGAPFAYRVYREDWKEKLADNVRTYEDLCVKAGRDPYAARRSMLVPIYVDTDRDRAAASFGQYVDWFYNKVSTNAQTGQADKVVKGYELAITENMKSRNQGYMSFEMASKYGAAVASDPDGCAEYLIDLQQRLGVDEFVLWTNLAGLPHELCENSMRLMMEQVIPKVNAAVGSATGEARKRQLARAAG